MDLRICSCGKFLGGRKRWARATVGEPIPSLTADGVASLSPLLISLGLCARPADPGAVGTMAASVTAAPLVTGPGRHPPPSVCVPQGCKQGKVRMT